MLNSSKILQIVLTNVTLIITLGFASAMLYDRNVDRYTIHSYCRSFKNCHDCKRAAYQCEWCHDVGCTNHARLYCPKKVFLDNVLKRDPDQRYCTEITTKGPIFVPANVRRFIKVHIKVDDMSLYERNIICEIKIEDQVIQVGGTLDKNSFYCDTTVFKIHRKLAIGHLRLIWGGAEPYSNTVLLIVYNCKHLAHTCRECQMLNADFKCGWCQDSQACSLIDDCPRQNGPWIPRNLTCGRDFRPSYVKSNKNIVFSPYFQ